MAGSSGPGVAMHAWDTSAIHREGKSMSRMSRCSMALALGLAALTAVGCGKTVIDDAKTEDAIKQNLERSAGKEVTAVECPSDVEVEKDATFDCTVSLAGGKEEVATMRVLNEDADIELTGLNPAK
jgi:hypothetical protein